MKKVIALAGLLALVSGCAETTAPIAFAFPSPDHSEMWYSVAYSGRLANGIVKAERTCGPEAQVDFKDHESLGASSSTRVSGFRWGNAAFAHANTTTTTHGELIFRCVLVQNGVMTSTQGVNPPELDEACSKPKEMRSNMELAANCPD